MNKINSDSYIRRSNKRNNLLLNNKYERLSFDNYCFIIGSCIIPIYSMLACLFPSLKNIFPNGLWGILTAFLIIVAIIFNIRVFSKYALLVFVFLLIAFMISSINIENGRQIYKIITTNSNIINFLFWGYFAAIRNQKNVLKSLNIVAYIIILANIVKLFKGGYGSGTEILNMSFANETTFYWAVILQTAFLKRNIISIIISISGGICLLIYGNRGAFLTIFAVIFIYILIYSTYKIKAYILAALSIIGIIIYAFFYDLLNWLNNLFISLNIESRSFESIINNNFWYDNGRYEIWYDNFQLIGTHPLLGSGIGADRALFANSSTYAHNLFIELFVDFGIFAGFLLSVLIIYIGFYMMSQKVEHTWSQLFVPFFCVGFFTLLTSQSLYIMRELLIAIMIFCSYKSYCNRSPIKNCFYIKK